MRTITLLTIALVLVAGMLPAQTRNGATLRVADYSIVVPATLAGNSDADLVPVIAGKVDSLPRKAAQQRFGILYRDNARSLGAATLLELVDAASGKILKKITVDEYFGKETATWKAIPGESRVNGSIVSAFQIKTKDFSAKFYRDIAVSDEALVPAGKVITLTFALETPAASRIKVRFLGRAEGSLAAGSQGFSVTADSAASRPAMAVFASQPVQIQLDAARKGKPQTFTMTTDEQRLEANQRTTILSLTVAGTSMRYGTYARKQADVLLEFFKSRKAAPSMIQYFTTDHAATTPGDTMTYTIHAHNIGTAPAFDVAINNPMPKGADYVEGSATGTGTEVSFTRTQATPPAQPRVSVISWKFTQGIKGGEDRWVQYKVVVR